MADLTTQNISYAGTAPSFDPATASDTAEVGPHRFIVYKNTNATARTVEVQVPNTSVYAGQITDNDVTYTLAGTTGELWIPLHSDYNSGTGRATITVGPAVTNVSVAVVHAGWTE